METWILRYFCLAEVLAEFVDFAIESGLAPEHLAKVICEDFLENLPTGGILYSSLVVHTRTLGAWHKANRSELGGARSIRARPCQSPKPSRLAAANQVASIHGSVVLESKDSFQLVAL